LSLSSEKLVSKFAFECNLYRSLHLGLRFNEWDVNDGAGLECAAGGSVDFAIASYVLKMYMVGFTS
jgi:hypothetical protein